MRKEKVTLGGRSYELGELPLRKARVFREMLGDRFGGVVAMLEGMPTMQVSDMAGISALLRSLARTLVDSTDTAVELLYAYSEDIANDKEHIEDNAVGSEVVDAAMMVITLVFPFLEARRLTGLIKRLGSQPDQT